MWLCLLVCRWAALHMGMPCENTLLRCVLLLCCVPALWRASMLWRIPQETVWELPPGCLAVEATPVPSMPEEPAGVCVCVLECACVCMGSA